MRSGKLTTHPLEVIVDIFAVGKVYLILRLVLAVDVTCENTFGQLPLVDQLCSWNWRTG